MESSFGRITSRRYHQPMKRHLLVVLLSVSCVTPVLAQDTLSVKQPAVSDTIRIRSAGSARQYFYGSSKALKPKEIGSVLQSNPAAFALFKESRSARTFGDILGYAGGFLIGYPLGVAIGGGEPNWILAGAGVGLAVASIPLTGSGNRKLRKAVRLYNDGIPRAVSSAVTPSLRLTGTSQGLGLALTF